MIAERIAREHHITQAVHYAGIQQAYCACGLISAGDPEFAAHVAEVAEAAVRAEVTVTPSREEVARELAIAGGMARDTWDRKKDSRLICGEFWRGADRVLALLPGRSEAES